jgi:hypothetical protein
LFDIDKAFHRNLSSTCLEICSEEKLEYLEWEKWLQIFFTIEIAQNWHANAAILAFAIVARKAFVLVNILQLNCI